MEYLAIINQQSGNRDPAIIEAEFLNYLNLHGIKVEIKRANTSEQVCQYAKEGLENKVKTLISIGGDGTLNNIINQIAYTETTLGIIPNGTANILATSLGIPKDITKAASIVFSGNTKKIDLGMVDNTYFAVTTGCGVDSLMIENTKREIKKKFGIFAYVINFINTIINPPKAVFELKIDNQKVQQRGSNIIFINTGNILGKIISFKPDYSHHDDMIDICIYSPDKYEEYLPILLDFIFEDKLKNKTKKIYHYKGKEITFTCKPILPIHIDGDIFGFPPVKVFSCPDALSVCVPKKIDTFLMSPENFLKSLLNLSMLDEP